MPNYLGLNLSTFVSAVTPELLEKYMERYPLDVRPEGWHLLHGDSLQHYLDQCQSEETVGQILDDLSNIDGLSKAAPGVVVRAYVKHGISFDPNEKPQGLALRLFLHHPDAYEFAWSRYLLFTSTSKLSLYPMPAASVRITSERVRAYQKSVQEWFVQQAKGRQCNIKCYEDNGETILRVQRGNYVRTQSIWKGDLQETLVFRPRLEDVLVYDPADSLLQIKAPSDKDRDHYLLLFATHMAGDPGLAEEAKRQVVFSLVPLQDGSFSFAGNGLITKIELRQIRLKVSGLENPFVEIKAGDVLRALQYDLDQLPLSNGILTFARLKFHLRPHGARRTTATIWIAPPAETNLTEKKHSEIIEPYLREQGVKLL